MQYSSRILEQLVTELARLPGIGKKTAQRLAFHLLRTPDEEALRLSDAVRALKERVDVCTICGNITEEEPCVICRDPRREKDIICVVETPVTVQFEPIILKINLVISAQEADSPEFVRL